MDMLCTPQAEVGFIGSAFFLGVILGIFTLPNLADKYGRLKVLYVTYVMQLVWFVAIIITTNLKIAIICIFILGFGHPGKNIVCLNYALEQIPNMAREQVVSIFLVIEGGWIGLISLTYQYGDRSWKSLQYFGLVITILSMLFVFIYFFESPKYYHMQKKYK